MDDPNPTREVEALELPLDRDLFLRGLVRELSGVLEEIVGLQEASGFVSVVGQNVGAAIDEQYRAALGAERLSRAQVEAVLVDLKRRIQGDFSVVSSDERRIVLANRACPFGDKVLGRPSMCMMTSNVFGSIAAQNLGWAKVELQQTIAEGHPGCRIVVHLEPGEVSDEAEGREYHRS